MTALIDRRDFLAGAGAIFAATLAPRKAAALDAAEAVYGAAYRDASGAFGIAILDPRGEILSHQALPARGHGFAYDSNRTQAVVFGRRPRNFALAFDLSGARGPIVFHTPPDRHFYGHGVFSPGGRLLYAAENDFDNGAGMIGIYDATDRFTRKGEFSSHGIGPHEILFAGGKTLCVANGGIQTHPDYGRQKLNLAAMEPSIVFIDAATGSLLEKHGLPGELSRLSLRHAAADARGRFWIGGQYEGDRSHAPPLIACVAPGEKLALVELPEPTTRKLRNYVGSVAASTGGDRIAFTSPKGNAMVILDPDDATQLDLVDLEHVCGVASAESGFLTSSDNGRFAGRRHDLAWDNHIARLG